jgi:hypothetical protein
MPVTAAIGDIYQVRVRGHIEGQETNNVLHFKNLNTDSDVELHLILVLASCFITHLIPVLASAWALQDIVWKKIYPTLGVENITVPTGTLVGGNSGDPLPSFVSSVVSIRTAEGGRSKRGRMYVAGTPESASLGSALNTSNAFWTAFVAFIACIASNFIVPDPTGTDAWNLMIYSRKISGSHFPLANVTGLTAVTSLKPVQQLGTTRSRKVGRGA